jgi:uncharacterized protein (TIGR02453 family)
MNFQEVFDFLENLNANNHKAWMDENRGRYHKIKDNLYQWLLEIDDELTSINNDHHPIDAKRAINRINNNLLYHPQKPTYKDHFGMGLDKKPGKSDFYIHIGINECFLAGGFYKPKRSNLNSIRDAIDYNGDKLKDILNDKKFKEHFGGLMDEGKLTNAPKGFTNDHPHIDLLKNKSFAVARKLNKKNVLSSNFKDTIIDTYRIMTPFRKYLNQAVTV